ncbi:MAG: response regulator [Agathobacter sp.]|nr:response regulator [Agathobacter sp.]
MEPVYAFEDQEIYGDVYLVPVFIEGEEIKLVIAVDTEAELGQIPHKFSYEKRESSVAIGLAKGTVVIADDSKLSRKILRNMLEEEGYAVVAEATDGEEAISAYLQYKPDVITMDITMPNMNGIESIREILSIDRDAKIVMISAAGQQKKIIEALKIGAQKFITKPFEKQEVIECIETIIKSKFQK